MKNIIVLCVLALAGVGCTKGETLPENKVILVCNRGGDEFVPAGEGYYFIRQTDNGTWVMRDYSQKVTMYVQMQGEVCQPEPLQVIGGN